MAPSDDTSMHKPLLQTSESSTQEPTTVTIQGSCENTETEQNGTEESDFVRQRKITQTPQKRDNPKTFVVANENDKLEDNNNTSCTREGVIDEVVKDSDSEEQEKTQHNPAKGKDPQTSAQGNENGTLEDDTQIVNTYCTCEGVIDEVVKESHSEKQEKTTHNSGKGTDPKTFAQEKENDTLRDNIQIVNNPCTCDNVIEEVTEETNSKRQEKTTHTASTCQNSNEEVTGKEK